MRSRWSFLKGLEVGEYEFSKYIPRYLGETALWLPPEQIGEILSHLKALMASPNDQIASRGAGYGGHPSGVLPLLSDSL